MNQTSGTEMFEQLRKYAKRGLATVVFTVMLVGASAAILSGLAAAITALSGAYGNGRQVVASIPATATQYGTPTTRPSAGPSTPPSTSQDGFPTNPWADGTAGSDGTLSSDSSTASVIDRLNEQVDHMQSPIERSLDTGGVALGAQVQQTVGRVLSGVLQALFLDSSSSGGGS